MNIHDVVISLFLIAAIIGAPWACISSHRKEIAVRTEMASHGFDCNDVDVFLGRIGADWYDFKKSQGLQKQYEVFRRGESSDFTRQAMAKKDADSARTSAAAAGLATGIAIGAARSK